MTVPYNNTASKKCGMHTGRWTGTDGMNTKTDLSQHCLHFWQCNPPNKQYSNMEKNVNTAGIPRILSLIFIKANFPSKELIFLEPPCSTFYAPLDVRMEIRTIGRKLWSSWPSYVIDDLLIDRINCHMYQLYPQRTDGNRNKLEIVTRRLTSAPPPRFSLYTP